MKASRSENAGTIVCLAACSLFTALSGCFLVSGDSPLPSDAGGVAPAPPVTGGGPGCDVMALLDSRCTSCHSDPPTNGAPLSLTSLAALRASSAQRPGQSVVTRCLARMAEASNPMPPAPAPPASDAERAVIQAWVAAGSPECSPDDPDGANSEGSPNQIPQDDLFTCDPGQDGSSPSRLRRVGREEWMAAMPNVAIVNEQPNWGQFNPLNPNPSDEFSTYSSDETLDDAVLDFYLDPTLAGDKTGQELAAYVAGRGKDDAIACMVDDASPSDACADGFAARFLQRFVLFRPATDAEKVHLASFSKTVLAAEGGKANRPQTLATIAGAAWLTSGALFRAEMGAPSAGGDAPPRLSNWELANAVAYVLGDYAPGSPAQHFRNASAQWQDTAPPEGHLADVVAAANDGSIQNAATLAALVRAHAAGVDLARVDLGTQYYSAAEREPRGAYWTSKKIADFFREWLAYGSFPTIFKDGPANTSRFEGDFATEASYTNLQSGFARYDGRREATMVQQLDDAIARVVQGDQDVLRTLLTTRQFYVAAAGSLDSTIKSAKYPERPYNLQGPVPSTRDGRWVTLPANERAGVLTHPAWLAAHGGNFEDDPSLIHRGHWVRESLLCQYVPPLSEVRVAAVVGPSAPDQTARTRVEQATAGPECQACHKLMNTVGMPFEIYNHAGFVRTNDHDGSAPNGTSTLVDMPDPGLDGPVTSAIDFSEKLGNSNYVKRCFVRQSFRYFVGRDETRADACSLVKMEQAYDSSRGSFQAMLAALLASDAMRLRHKEGQ